ncbi:spore coat protein [Aquibacillus sp. 3ASR75-11]|uniref:Spore coat protein n=1 Tax=Terrihalobacillus insolitus TaxID=2950438 RepID=A0A9X4ANK5_9BACI|nr:spore coat protein [Terrihalobacillus insolitus]MDC3413615.1 spore coat protein [Terrihalobacillus insolitus]MDC3424628.1 spore coat protein [Terrihalobacillus insolitus]
MVSHQNNSKTVNQLSNQISTIDQNSREAIYVLNSNEVEVNTTDTQVAVSLQAALQVAIAIVVNISIADSSRAKQVTEELLAYSQVDQSNRQLVVVDGSENVTVTTTDTDVAASIQVLLQILIALVGQLDIL